jgi:hypothetical protein
MRLLAALSVCGLILAGCTSGAVTAPPTESGLTVGAPSAPTTLGADLPVDNPSLARVDAAGQTPDESVLALVSAHNEMAWQTVYSSYATPSVDLATAAREWADARETYLDFRVLEVRVTAENAAWVRVAYSTTPNPLSSVIRPMAVDEPGEWWPVHKVDGLWKTRWMPRQ